MKTIRIVDGDIELSIGRRMDFVRGKDKLFQDLKHWLLEPMGASPTARSFGSYLSEYIGQDDTQVGMALVTSEIRRILEVYQENQIKGLQRAKAEDELHLWSKSEVLEEIVHVEAFQLYDAVRVKIQLRTMADDGLAMDFDIPLDSIDV